MKNGRELDDLSISELKQLKRKKDKKIRDLCIEIAKRERKIRGMEDKLGISRYGECEQEDGN